MMETALGLTAQSMHLEMENPLLSTVAPSFTPQPELHQLTSCFADHTNDRGDFTYGHDNNQNDEVTPSLSILDNYLHYDHTVPSDLGYAAGSRSMGGPDWNFE
jgi:hypothetical protein